MDGTTIICLLYPAVRGPWIEGAGRVRISLPPRLSLTTPRWGRDARGESRLDGFNAV
jgi:hypothetical protein